MLFRIKILLSRFLYQFNTQSPSKARKFRIVFYTICGALLGFALLHPFSMVILSATGGMDVAPLKAFLMSYHLKMWPMWGWYALLGAIWGCGAAILVNQMRVLEGLLIICAWCGKIKDKDEIKDGDEYEKKQHHAAWKRLDKYLLENGVKQTHGICPECKVQVHEKLAEDRKNENASASNKTDTRSE